MGETSGISWTDRTFNPWRGCTKVAPERAHTRVLGSPQYWREPVKWNKAAEKAGERRRVFCASMADVFEDWTGPITSHRGGEILVNDNGARWTTNETIDDDWGCRELTLSDVRRDLFRLIDATPWLDWLLLTKRPENIRRMWPIKRECVRCGTAGTDCNSHPGEFVTWQYRRNVHIGTSVSNQKTTNGIDALIACRDLAPVLFLSVEPLVGRLDLGLRNWPDNMLVDWVIVGGESGAGARPCDVGDLRFIVEDCRAAGVPVFVKQLGSMPILPHDTAGQHHERTAEIYSWPDGTRVGNPTKDESLNGRVLLLNDSKGGDMAEWPESLRVQELPKSQASP